MKNQPRFDLQQTLECGQCFRWRRGEGGEYTGVAGGRALCVSQENLSAAMLDPFWADYFDCGLDYDGVRAGLSALCPEMALAAEFAPGIRVLRQEPWEALCSFIISQNNNIPRIMGIVERLCEAFGTPIKNDVGAPLYTFPTAEALAPLSVEDLAPLRSGFRARYIIDAARKVASGEVSLDAARTMPLDEARQSLMRIVGVGAKVADCALLYGLHRLEAFPMDVWMKRAMSELFPTREPSFFGEYAGIAQQYIFHYIRTGSAEGNETV